MIRQQNVSVLPTSSTQEVIANGNDQTIDGGEITNFDESAVVVDPLRRHKANTTRNLAYLLIGILGLSVIVHYGLTTMLIIQDKTDMLENLSSIFTTWLPVISGLASSAVTYYFTKEK